MWLRKGSYSSRIGIRDHVASTSTRSHPRCNSHAVEVKIDPSPPVQQQQYLEIRFMWVNYLRFLVQCPPLNIITLRQHESDNNNRMIQRVLFTVKVCIKGPAIFE
jgi:hypothetical protein